MERIHSLICFPFIISSPFEEVTGFIDVETYSTAGFKLGPDCNER